MKEENPSMDFAQQLQNGKAQNQSILEPTGAERKNQYEYFQKMKNIQCVSPQQIEEKMRIKQFLWSGKNFRTSFEKVLRWRSGNCYNFSISLGHFQIGLTLLKINMSSELLSRHQFSFGCYSSVYIQYFENTHYVIKSQKIPEESINNFDQKFDRILQEFMIYKIAQIFQFGPKMRQPYWFDIICFRDSMQFSMQLCGTSPAIFHRQREKLELDLLTGMKIMHFFQIVHRDIKPSNISWSPSLKKWVLLDFGLSTSIQQKPGEKTLALYCGTYKYVSEQLKNLYHLKRPQFVDLYANDMYGLKTSCLNVFCQHHLELPQNQSSDFLPLLCRMKFCIWYQYTGEVLKKFIQHFSLRQEFLKLLRIELDRAEQNMKMGSNSLLYLAYHQVYKKLNVINQEKIQQNSKDNQIQQLEKEQKQKMQLFIKEEQNLKSVFMLEKSQKLRKIILQKRNSLPFMKQIFIFFQQTLHSNKENSWNRLKLITDIILEIFGLEYKRKNWILKFHDLLIIFQQKFLEQNQYFLLKQIAEFYQIFNDRGRLKKIKSLLFQKKSEFQKFVEQIQELYNEISAFSQIDLSRKKLYQLKQKIRQSKYKDDRVFFAPLRVAELMLSSRLLSEDEKEQFEMFIEVLNLRSSQFKNESSRPIIIQSKQWMASPFQRNCFQTQNKQSGNFQPSITPKLCIYFVEKLMKSEISKRKQQKKMINILFYMKLYPLLKEVPQSFAIQANLTCRNYEKTSQIALNLFLFNKDCLQQICEQLAALLSRFSQLSQQVKQAEFILQEFLASYQRKLKVELIQNYWFFYRLFFFFGRELFKNNDKLKKQFIYSLQYIINFFYSQDLSLRTRIVINLFIHLKMYYEGNSLKVNQFLKKFPQILQMDAEKKTNMHVIIHFFSTYERMQNKYSLQNTSLFDHLRKNNSLSVYFHTINMFFQVVLFGKVLESKQQEALILIVEQTKYETKKNIFNHIFFILQKFINFNSHNKIQMLMYFLKLDFRTIRQNNYLSSLILLIYLKYEEEFLMNLKFKEILRIYILSIISINKLGKMPRIVQLQKQLKYKFRSFEQGIKPRKKKILNHQEDYARCRTFFLQREFEKGIESKLKDFGKFKASFESKKAKLEQNMKKKTPLIKENSKLVSDLLHNN